MARFSGKNGKLYIGAVQLHIKDWDLNDEADLPESTDSQSGGGKTRIVGLFDWSFTFTGYWDDTTSPIGAGFTPGTAGTIKLYVDGTNFYSGACLIGQLSPSVDIGGGKPVEFKGSGSGNGLLTRPA